MALVDDEYGRRMMIHVQKCRLPCYLRLDQSVCHTPMSTDSYRRTGHDVIRILPGKSMHGYRWDSPVQKLQIQKIMAFEDIHGH
jgi:hypothetical protein